MGIVSVAGVAGQRLYRALIEAHQALGLDWKPKRVVVKMRHRRACLHGGC
ncbi:MAG: hypothetical protein V3T83_02635 [Acidobacteriota bacterium]